MSDRIDDIIEGEKLLFGFAKGDLLTTAIFDLNQRFPESIINASFEIDPVRARIDQLEIDTYSVREIDLKATKVEHAIRERMIDTGLKFCYIAVDRSSECTITHYVTGHWVITFETQRIPEEELSISSVPPPEVKSPSRLLHPITMVTLFLQGVILQLVLMLALR